MAANISTARLEEVEIALGLGGEIMSPGELPGALAAAGLPATARAVRTLLIGTGQSAPSWWPAERAIPHLIGDITRVRAVTCNYHIIELYRHNTTGNYIALDADGQPWDISPVPGETTRYTGAPTTLPAALADFLGN